MITPRRSRERLDDRAAAPNDWYIVTPFAPRVSPTGELSLPPATLAHAKRVGTTTTACGVDSTSWYRMLEVAFPASGVANCRTCGSLTLRPGSTS